MDLELLPVDLADADAYMAAGARATPWLAVGDDDARTLALSEAHRWLSTLRLRHRDPECCPAPFADRWVAANAEVALALHRNPDAVLPVGTQSGPTVQSQALGDLSQSFFSMDQWKTKYGYRDHPLLRAFPWLGPILACWLPSRARIVDRVRS